MQEVSKKQNSCLATHNSTNTRLFGDAQTSYRHHHLFCQKETGQQDT